MAVKREETLVSKFEKLSFKTFNELKVHEDAFAEFFMLHRDGDCYIAIPNNTYHIRFWLKSQGIEYRFIADQDDIRDDSEHRRIFDFSTGELLQLNEAFYGLNSIQKTVYSVSIHPDTNSWLRKTISDQFSNNEPREETL